MLVLDQVSCCFMTIVDLVFMSCFVRFRFLFRIVVHVVLVIDDSVVL